MTERYSLIDHLRVLRPYGARTGHPQDCVDMVRHYHEFMHPRLARLAGEPLPNSFDNRLYPRVLEREPSLMRADRVEISARRAVIVAAQANRAPIVNRAIVFHKRNQCVG